MSNTLSVIGDLGDYAFYRTKPGLLDSMYGFFRNPNDPEVIVHVRPVPPRDNLSGLARVYSVIDTLDPSKCTIFVTKEYLDALEADQRLESLLWKELGCFHLLQYFARQMTEFGRRLHRVCSALTASYLVGADKILYGNQWLHDNAPIPFDARQDPGLLEEENEAIKQYPEGKDILLVLQAAAAGARTVE